MKKLTYTIAIFMAMVATSVFAHHPAAEMVSEETYEMINENLDGTPHLDMDLDMAVIGYTAGDSAMATAAQDQEGWAAVAGEGQTQDGTMTLEQPQEAMGPAAGAGTIDLMENVGQ